MSSVAVRRVPTVQQGLMLGPVDHHSMPASPLPPLLQQQSKEAQAARQEGQAWSGEGREGGRERYNTTGESILDSKSKSVVFFNTDVHKEQHLRLVKGTIQRPRGTYIDRDVNLNSRPSDSS